MEETYTVHYRRRREREMVCVICIRMREMVRPVNVTERVRRIQLICSAEWGRHGIE